MLQRSPKSLRDVVDGGLCTGCGLCQSLAGSDRIEMQIGSGGHLRPLFKVTLDAGEEAALIKACPGVTILGPEPSQYPKSKIDSMWGPIRALRRTWASDPNIRHRAASGGTLTALACYLLDSKRVDAVLHIRASPAHPTLSEAWVSRNSHDAIEGSQSRYGPAAPLIHVRSLLEEGLRFAVVGKPCDINAIRNLARADNRVRDQIPYLLTIFCGGVPNARTPIRIANYVGISEEEISLFRWRGNGWPGATHVESADGKIGELTYDETWYDPAKPGMRDFQWRCKICPDSIGEVADLSCPDGWVLRDGKPIHEEAPGVNAVVERTQVGSELVTAAIGAGYLQTGELSYGDFVAMHPNHSRRKLGEPARLLALRMHGAALPTVRRYRLMRTALHAGPRLIREEYHGATRRIHSGQSHEKY